MSQNNYVLDKLGLPEVLTQLAEEASELAQAALKYRRALMGVNPTPVTKVEALARLREEIADVESCLTAVGPEVRGDVVTMLRTSAAKLKRWEDRLKRVPPRGRE